MARQSARSAPQKRTVPAAAVGASKRAKVDDAETSTAPRRATPRRSQHFKRAKYAESEDEDAAQSDGSAFSSEADAESGYDEDADAGAATSESSAVEDEEDNSSSAETAPKKKGPRGGRQSAAAVPIKRAAEGQELWRPGVKTGLGPGTQVIIEKPKPRTAGKTPYRDETIHPNTMLFLGDLGRNNDREWLKMHDPDYRTSLKDFTSFVEQLQLKIIEFDETVPELPMKDVVFRIYRDVRFSKDQTPYKDHFSAAWSRTGRKGPFAAYYLQIKPGGSFIGGGLWQPEANAVAAIRRQIERRPQRLKGVLQDSGIRREFLNGAKADAKSVVKAFTAKNKESALKTKPKGYDATHPEIELLRLRSYTLGRPLSDEEVAGTGALERVAGVMRCLEPLVTYLNSVVMPDEPASASDDDEEGDEDGEEE